MSLNYSYTLHPIYPHTTLHTTHIYTHIHTQVDRCYGWKTMPDSPIRAALAAQDENCRLEFKDRTSQTILQLNEQGLNAKLYWENDDPLDTISLVPTSAISGEGVPDLLYNLITLSQERLIDQLLYMEYVQCTVLEVKAIDGLGFTVDVVLLNGTIREGDTIVVSTLEGPVVTSVRALLTPPPNREMRCVYVRICGYACCIFRLVYIFLYYTNCCLYMLHMYNI